jgi:hypothetical protein
LAVRDFLANLPEHHVQRWIRHTLTVPDLMAIALNLTPFGNNDFNLIDHLPCFVLSFADSTKNCALKARMILSQSAIRSALA